MPASVRMEKGIPAEARSWAMARGPDRESQESCGGLRGRGGGCWVWGEQARCVIRDLVFQGYGAHLLLSTSEK